MMYKVVTGPFHPTLETALVQEVQRVKSSDPFAPMAIVVPSELLRRRLQWLLCAEHHCSLFDFHFLTFHQLALRMHREYVLSHPEEDSARFEMVDDLCFELVLNSLFNPHQSGLVGVAPKRFTPGTCHALWSTVRDLKEGMIDPQVVLQGIEEGMFGEEEGEKLRNILTAFRMVQEVSRTLNIGSADDLATMMLPWREQSSFLARLQRVCYYGFYDLTQVQLSLFETIAGRAPVTMYFPLCGDSAYSFSRRFFERYLQGGQQGAPDHTEAHGDGGLNDKVDGSPEVLVLNTVGSEGELTVVCKTILNLVEHHHFRHDEIGVVARSLEPYRSSLRRIFDHHHIPFSSSGTAAVLQEPFVKHLLQLSRLPITDFYWRDVLDVLLSPYYRLDRIGVPRQDIHSESWHVAVKTMGVHRGQEQWARLVSLTRPTANQSKSPNPSLRDGQNQFFETKQMEWLHRLVSELIHDCLAIPTHGTIEELTNAFLTLANKHLTVPGMTDLSIGPVDQIPHQPDLSLVMQDAMTVLRHLHMVGQRVSWEEWTQWFHRALNDREVPITPDMFRGVRVLDAMSSRGLPFRALFIIGLNEKVFPRYIREDAFLRDRSRRVLGDTFGYKIDEKLSGYEEERLLFALLMQAARERVYLVYQRADTHGRSLSPSSYLNEYLSPDGGLRSSPLISIPRRLSDRLNHPIFEAPVLTREECALKHILHGYDPFSLFEEASCKGPLFRNGWTSIRERERQSHRLGAYDGLLDWEDRYWEEWVKNGISPTSLEQYARCPFQYFAKQVLGVKDMRPPVVEEPPAPLLGNVCHVLLREIYEQLIESGWPEHPIASGQLKESVIELAESVFRGFSESWATGYWLIWQLTQDRLIDLVTEVIEADQQGFMEHGLRPVAFEVPAQGEFWTLGRPFRHLKIQGRMDRIDSRAEPPGMRVIDYKFQAGARMKTPERDLPLAGIRGLHLQPPLYILMNQFRHPQLNQLSKEKGLRPERVDFVYLAPQWDSSVVRAEYEGTNWQGRVGRQLRKTIHTLLQGIRSGRYFILPGDYCRHCEISSVCRRFHGPTWRRSHHSSPGIQLRKIRTQDLHDD